MLTPKIALQLAKYYSVSVLALATDLALFQVGTTAHVAAPTAGAVSYAVAALLHFTANRQWNFRNFDRSPLRQARTYAVIFVSAWAITVGIIAECTIVWHMQPLVAKLIAVAVTLPLGFLGHKHFTYGAGFTPLWRALVARAGAKRHSS